MHYRLSVLQHYSSYIVSTLRSGACGGQASQKVPLPSHISKSLDLFLIQSLVYINPLVFPRPSSSEASVLVACAFQHPHPLISIENIPELNSSHKSPYTRVLHDSTVLLHLLLINSVILLCFMENSSGVSNAFANAPHPVSQPYPAHCPS